MSEALVQVVSELYWSAPAGKDGFRLDAAGPGGAPALVPTGAKHEQYHVMAEEPGLFLRFAGLEGSPESFAWFANQHGGLTISIMPDVVWLPDSPRWNLPVPPFEPISFWRACHAWLRHLVSVWQLLQIGDVGTLGGMVTFRGGTFSFAAPEPPAAWDPLPPLACEIDWHGFRDHLGPTMPVAVPVLFCDYLDKLVNAELARVARLLVRSSAPLLPGPGPRVCLLAADLWGALVIQFSLALLRETKYRQCPVCGRWFPLGPGNLRADKVTCSTACRSKQARLKKATMSNG